MTESNETFEKTSSLVANEGNGDKREIANTEII
jgi:hypothetical protein